MEREVTGFTPAEPFRVPVAGGELAGGQWHADAGGTPLVGIHGITANHVSWSMVAAALPGVRLIAPDLRGRGRSNGLPGPYGLTQHADDIARMLDGLGVERAIVAGHSMGAFVAVWLAERHPDRVERLVLIDGGLPVYGTADLGPARDRLRMTFASEEEYLAFWRRHPALGPWWNDAVEAYALYDLVGAPPELRSSVSEEAMSANAIEVGGADGYEEALAGLTLPIAFVRAPRGLLNTDPLYPPEEPAEWRTRLPWFEAFEAEDVNHYTIVMTEAGVRQLTPHLPGAYPAHPHYHSHPHTSDPGTSDPKET
nr:alpha/beta fold hydrolase [Leifsonia shinshuensis]